MTLENAFGSCASCKAIVPVLSMEKPGWFWFSITPHKCPICDHVGQPEIISDDEEMTRQYRKQFEAAKEVARLNEWLERIKWNLGDGDDHPNCAAAFSCVQAALAGVKSEDCTQLTTCKCDYCSENPPT